MATIERRIAAMARRSGERERGIVATAGRNAERARRMAERARRMADGV